MPSTIRERKSTSRVRSIETGARKTGLSKGSSSSSTRGRSRSVGKRRVSFTDLQAYSEGNRGAEADKDGKQVNNDEKGTGRSGGGDGMTIWWIALTMLTLFFRFEATIRQEVFKMEVGASYLETALEWLISTSKGDNPTEIALTLLRGVSCVTGLCVGIGYYTFKICFRMVEGSMSRQLYEAHDVGRHCSYEVFLMLDILTHVGAVCAIAWAWARHITPAAAIISFMFHRLWSWTFSTGRQLFFTRVHEVYGFAPMPKWTFLFLYGSEIIVISTSIFATA